MRTLGQTVVLAVAALMAAPGRAVQAADGGTSRDPHARALVLAMAHAARDAGAAAPECRAVTWTVVRPFGPGVFDTTGWLHVRVCRAGIPCREFDVDVWDGHVADGTRIAPLGSSHGRSSLPPLDLDSVGAGLPRADAALLLAVAYEEGTARGGERTPLPGPVKADPWFDTETRTWRAEPSRAGSGDLGCDRWTIDLRIGDVVFGRWAVDLARGSVSRRT